MYFDDVDFMRLTAQARKEHRTVEDYIVTGVLESIRESRQRQLDMTAAEFSSVREHAIMKELEDCPGLILGEVSGMFPWQKDIINSSPTPDTPRILYEHPAAIRKREMAAKRQRKAAS